MTDKENMHGWFVEQPRIIGYRETQRQIRRAVILVRIKNALLLAIGFALAWFVWVLYE